MVGLVTNKNDEDILNIKALEWGQHFFHCKSDLVEIQTHPSFYGSSPYLQE